MVVARKTARRTKLEKQATEVIGWLSEAKSCADVARSFGVSTNAVIKFQNRHAEEIEERRNYYLSSVQQFDIAHRGRRIAGLDKLRTSLEAEIDTNGAIDVDRQGVRSTPLVKELRAVYHDAAEQLGQLPRPEVNVQANIVLVREVTRGDGDHPPLG